MARGAKDQDTHIRRRLGRRLRRAVGALLCLLLVYVGAAVLYIVGPGGRDERRPADVIIILGGGATAGVPSPEYRARLDHADALWRAGYAPVLLCTGGSRAGTGGPEALAARSYLRSRGVPAGAIVLEPRSHTTWQNLRNARALMHARGWRTALLVSDRYHLARARLMARSLGLDVAPSPSPAAPASRLRQLLLELIKLTAWPVEAARGR